MRLPSIRPRVAEPYLADTVVALMVLAVIYAPFLLPRANQPGPFSVWAWIFAAGTALPLIWRRRFPLACLLAIFVAMLCYNQVRNAASEPIGWGMLVAAYSIAWGGRRVREAAVLLVIGAVAIALSRSLTTSVIGVLTTTGAYVLGLLARHREIRLQALAHRAGEMERERELDLARAATAERARIARDMHDILAHAVSIMVVQAEAGPVVVRANPDRAEQAFDAIAEAGRDAMVQLRRMLGVLKEEHDTGSRAPQPTVADVPALVEQVDGTPGLRVGLRVAGEVRPLPADAEVAAYRIVQEALTNTVKHAGASRVTVSLDWSDTGLEVTVSDNGDGGGKTAGAGHGLIGIRERAAACGGTAEAGPVRGGYRVTATLPYAQVGAPV
ncbi:sensor histidine kinase [Actinoallomurus iriomotensis]|uniref:histidine kinase n=1 Tax=Actinoallomurus iriomotensis TaxID=478107 RepID=A0A9W6W326_9ACTN|nr:histidine kinase [Actinoallomurus iriomotensis]GLY88477.1 two-component sensor histidine kinase [Actinoallomurus iriomotensis]